MGTEIQEFAALLRGLKERSGLSYGALARRLHMSTSTVHRYCNGEAVPHDYAPVERFARVCGASADELMALHRRWILADEAKRRGARKPDPAGAVGEAGEAARAAAPTTVPVGEAEPDQDPVPEADGAAAEEFVPEAGRGRPAQGSEAQGSDAPGSDVQGSGAPGSDAQVSGFRSSGAESLAEDVTPEAGTGARPAPRPRTRRKLRVLLTAVAVVALVVPAALVVRGLGDDGPADGKRSNAELSPLPAVPSGEASASPRPSGSRSPSATAGSTAPTPTASAGRDAPGPTASGRQDAGVPVRATISSYNWESPCGQYYLLDQKPDDVPPPPAPQYTRGWARSLDGVDGGAMKLALTVQGTSGEAVVLNGLHVRVLGRNPALAWNAYSMGSGCGSGVTPQSFDVDLDDSLPRSKPVAGQDGDMVVPAKDFPYKVSSTDVEVFHLDAHVEGHDVTWYLELEWTSGGRSGTLRIDDGGKPFRTSSLATRPEYSYRADTAQWVPSEH
ncbi:helix-turn-helix domain-containing protein [Streptomyces sp. NPDC048590]|uniref:helix-turn-helix domain-containing protein n=1 Tax=Streptomyces sp. NPDC048590 TaxID=3365574 RepID=UPI003713CA4B